MPTLTQEALLAQIAAGHVVARTVDLQTGAWTLAAANAVDECERGERSITSVHGPRWRMLIIGGSEIAHYLAEVASTVDYQVFVCDPREEYRTAWRAQGAQWIDGMPDDAVLAFRPDGHSVILTVSHDPKLDDMRSATLAGGGHCACSSASAAVLASSPAIATRSARIVIPPASADISRRLRPGSSGCSASAATGTWCTR